MLQHTAIHCNMLQTLQQTLQQALQQKLQRTLQHAADTATNCNTLHYIAIHSFDYLRIAAHAHLRRVVLHTLYYTWSSSHTATPCNTPHHPATRCNTLQHAATRCNTLQHAATHCNTLQYIATHCNALQHTATHCNKRAHRQRVVVHRMIAALIDFDGIQNLIPK